MNDRIDTHLRHRAALGALNRLLEPEYFMLVLTLINICCSEIISIMSLWRIYHIIYGSKIIFL